MPRRPGSRNRSKQSPQLPRATTEELVARDFLFLVNQGAQKDTLGWFLEQLRTTWTEHNEFDILRASTVRKKDYVVLKKAVAVVRKWLNDPILKHILTNPTPGLSTDDDCNVFKVLPDKLRDLEIIARSVVGPTWKKRSNGQRSMQPLLKQWMPPLFRYYAFLWNCCEYVKESTGKYHSARLENLLCAVLGTVTRKAVKKQITTAYKYWNQQSPPHLPTRPLVIVDTDPLT